VKNLSERAPGAARLQGISIRPDDPFTGIGRIDFRNTFRHDPSPADGRLYRADPAKVLQSM
jgi:hypothetical protein